MNLVTFAFLLLVAPVAPPAGAALVPAVASGRAPSDVAAPPPSATLMKSGVASEIIVRGRGAAHPGDNDCVKLHYTAWKRDGSLLGSSGQQQEPVSECLASMIPGVAQAVRTMVVGERRRVWVPARLMVRAGDDDALPTTDATFDVALFEIVKAPPVPSHLKSPPASATKTASGLVVQVLKRGTGTQHPTATSRVQVDFSGWTSDGRLIESSVMAHHPAVFEMAAVIRGWREALSSMVTGQKVRLWIPAALAYGPKPRRGQPKGDLVYELELLSLDH
jgi:peptidylprolyl isomerase